tara:strand:+ start:90 stop:335 length:246 start_codon:yes stop_codon:yes gene_type:complete
MLDQDTRDNMIEYIKILKAIENDMEPYKEAKRELKSDFVSQGRLSREQISNIVRAYRMLKKDEDINEFIDAYNALTSRGMQ